MMIWLTKYWREEFWPIAIILLYGFGGLRGKRTTLVIVISMLILVPLRLLAKNILARSRPSISKSDFLIAADSEYTFPSGHALILSAGAAVSLALFRGSTKNLIISLNLLPNNTCMYVESICWGHYPSDVIGDIITS
ncbi:MAG: phosphatase PAP2 family protein [Nitrososphaeraceae archaeon]|nr:phosphatase PAP2 family protein [Nitrososphaeraceae archaeon]